MATKLIQLKLNNEVRSVEASIIERATFNVLCVYGIAMTTATGSKTHRGTAYIVENPNSDSRNYTIADIYDLRYAGMRGNGHANKSRMRYVGFAD